MHDEAAGHTVAALMAGIIFVASIGVVLVQSGETGRGSEDEINAAVSRQEAGNLADLLFGSPGLTADGEAWVVDEDHAADADGLTRLGLLAGSGNHLDFDKFDNLRLAPFAADDEDGYVNYPEAADALGLDEAGLDFHIRAYPSLPGIRAILEKGYKDPNLALAYIGDIDAVDEASGPPTGLTVTSSSFACAPSDVDSSVLNLTAEVTNGGSSTTQFHYVFDLETSKGDARIENVGGVLPPTSPDNREVAWADLADARGINCSHITDATLEVTDPSGTLLHQFVLGAPTATDSGAPATQDLSIRTSTPYFVQGNKLEFEINGPKNTDPLDVVVRKGTQEFCSLDGVLYKNLQDPICGDEADDFDPGHYVILVTHTGTTTTVRHTAMIVAQGNEPDGYGSGGGTTGSLSQWSEAAKKETGFLDTLIQRFCPFYYDSDTKTPIQTDDEPPVDIAHGDRCKNWPDGDGRPSRGQYGDVFPHTWPELKAALNDRIYYPTGHAQAGQVDVNTTSGIVIGSGVNHQGLVHVKSELADWVKAGGTLIVFGSDDSNTQWMQSIFHLGIHSSSNGVATVHDEGHPSLHTPDDLSYDAYDNGEQFWKFTSGATDEMFTNIIADADETQTILSVSNPGAFGKGSLVITSWYAYDLDRTGSDAMELEGMKLTNNLIMLGYRTLYLDYGPPIPEGVEVTPAISKRAILHPELGIVTLDLAVYVFPSD